jgi:hypothetical protein
MRLRRQRETQWLLLTWPEAKHAEDYRLLLRDESLDRLIAKIECRHPNYRLDVTKLDPDHQYAWGVQTRQDKFEDWAYHLPYMHLFRPHDPPSPTELEWEPTGAAVYRVVINDRQLDLAVIKDALIGTRYPVDWRRLNPDHDHMYEIQRLIPGPQESWETLYEYQPLPAPAPDVRVQPSPAPRRSGIRPLLFLWTCDTEVNARRMRVPDPSRAVDEQIFVRDGDREYGINFMMDLLEEFNFRGTFFLDILMEHQVGRADLERTIEAIVSHGHDVQLHLHPSPNLLFAADPELGRFAPALTHDDRDLFRGALDLAVGLFTRRVGYAPVAYRSGAYHLCDEFLSVLPEFGITIDSSLYPFKNCRVSDWMRTRSEPFWVGDVLEVPVSWMLRTSDERSFEAQQLAPTRGGTQQDAFGNYAPRATSEAPATLVYLAHSFSFMSVDRSPGQKALAQWNKRYEEHVPPDIFQQVRMDRDSEFLLFDRAPDTERIALMTRLLHRLASRTDVVSSTVRELHDGGLERWRRPRELPVDSVPVWDSEAGSGSTAPLQLYSPGLIERFHQQQEAA